MNRTKFFAQTERICPCCGGEIPRGAIIWVTDEDLICDDCHNYEDMH